MISSEFSTSVNSDLNQDQSRDINLVMRLLSQKFGFAPESMDTYNDGEYDHISVTISPGLALETFVGIMATVLQRTGITPTYSATPHIPRGSSEQATKFAYSWIHIIILSLWILHLSTHIDLLISEITSCVN